MAPSTKHFATTTSAHSYEETIARLSSAIRDTGSVVFATIDQAAAARSVGLALRPTTLIVFGNPKGGTPVMDAFPEIALALPLKIAVWDVNGTVTVVRDCMAMVARDYGVPTDHPAIVTMDAVLDKLMRAISAA